MESPLCLHTKRQVFWAYIDHQIPRPCAGLHFKCKIAIAYGGSFEVNYSTFKNIFDRRMLLNILERLFPWDSNDELWLI